MTEDDRKFVNPIIDSFYWIECITPICFLWFCVFLVPRNLNWWLFWVPMKLSLQSKFWLIPLVVITFNLSIHVSDIFSLLIHHKSIFVPWLGCISCESLNIKGEMHVDLTRVNTRWWHVQNFDYFFTSL